MHFIVAFLILFSEAQASEVTRGAQEQGATIAASNIWKNNLCYASDGKLVNFEEAQLYCPKLSSYTAAVTAYEELSREETQMAAARAMYLSMDSGVRSLTASGNSGSVHNEKKANGFVCHEKYAFGPRPSKKYVCYKETSDNHIKRFRTNPAPHVVRGKGSSVYWEKPIPGGFCRQINGTKHLSIVGYKCYTLAVF